MRTLKQKGKDIVWVVAGNAVLALAVSMFILPYDILSGGVAGIAVALQPLIPLPVTLMVNLLVVGLFILGACFLGKEFAMKTILSSLIYPVFLTFFSGRVPVLDLDPILASLYGGLLGGMGVGMALRTGASTGGMDIPPLIVHKLTHIEIAKLVLITDAMLGKGMPDGDFEFSGLHCRKHGQHVQVVETGRRAGSAIGMNDAVRMMGEMCGCTPCELVQMACVNPASLAQAGNRKGRLAAGMDADLALFDKQWQCRATMVEGRWVYRR